LQYEYTSIDQIAARVEYAISLNYEVMDLVENDQVKRNARDSYLISNGRPAPRNDD